MADPKYDRTVQQSLLDRLIDLEPENRYEAPTSRAESLRRFRLAVKRDLEWLLNTTRSEIEIPESCPLAKESVLAFGLPDISNVSLNSYADETRLLRSLEQAIENFEPRLSRAKVTSTESLSASQHAVKFHVEAVLMVDPAPERIAFDTVLEIAKGAYTVKEG
jgi:type VI secretion system protein ImpF